VGTLLKHIIGGRIAGGIQVTGRKGRKCKQLLDDREETRRYCKLKEEALDNILWRIRFGRDYGPVIRQAAQRIN
jgi:hypothetical protein